MTFIPEHFPHLEQQEARLERALVGFSATDQGRIRSALAFARSAHEGQFRLGTTNIPYIIHPIRVACSLVDEFQLHDADACMAALLHDVVEDCAVSLDIIAERFGVKICGYVATLTWEKGVDAKWRQAHVMLRAPKMVRYVKAADVIDNARANWQITDRQKLLRMLYGYAHWGRRVAQSIGPPATIFLDAALAKSSSIHFGEEPEPSLPPNAEKSLAIDVATFPFKMPTYERSIRYPIRTHVVSSSDDLIEVVKRYAVQYLRPGDLLAISERIVAITQGRAFPISAIQPSAWATFLVRFVHKSPYGIGLARSETMELAIREAGLARVLFAACIAAITKPFGLRGMFYRVVGANINAIDGPCDYTIPLTSGERYAKLGPKDPTGVATHLAREIGIDVAIIDANDIGVNILGVSEGVDAAFVRAAFKDNPLGQSTEQTPMAIVRRSLDRSHASTPRG